MTLDLTLGRYEHPTGSLNWREDGTSFRKMPLAALCGIDWGAERGTGTEQGHFWEIKNDSVTGNGSEQWLISVVCGQRLQAKADNKGNEKAQARVTMMPCWWQCYVGWLEEEKRARKEDAASWETLELLALRKHILRVRCSEENCVGGCGSHQKLKGKSADLVSYNSPEERKGHI